MTINMINVVCVCFCYLVGKLRYVARLWHVLAQKGESPLEVVRRTPFVLSAGATESIAALFAAVAGLAVLLFGPNGSAGRPGESATCQSSESVSAIAQQAASGIVIGSRVVGGLGNAAQE